MSIFQSQLVFLLTDTIVTSQTNMTAQAQECLRFILTIFLFYIPVKALASIFSTGLVNASGQAKKSLRGDLIFTWGISIPVLLLGTYLYLTNL